MGRVTDIRVTPNATLVEIDFEVFLDRISTIGLNTKRLQAIAKAGGFASNLRAEIMGNPVTGVAYLLLAHPENPPAPMQLGFKPDRPYIPSMPSPFAMVQDRLPVLVEQADATLQTLREIVARMPTSLDRSDHFFTNVQRIMRESQLPMLSADSRKFFTTTSAQIEQIKSEMDGVMGTEGALVKALR